MAVYALLGGSRTLSVSTTSTIAVLTASTLNVRSVNRKIVAAVGRRPGTEIVILDATTLARVITVTQEFVELERALAGQGAQVWIAALPPQTLELVTRLPRWSELERNQQLYPTTLAAFIAYRSHHRQPTAM